LLITIDGHPERRIGMLPNVCHNQVRHRVRHTGKFVNV
jgi:hypothetical protein